CLKSVHNLKAIHAGHLQVEQDEVIVVLLMQRTDLFRIHCGGNGGVAGITQHFLQQSDIGVLIVNYQDGGVKNLGLGNHHDCSFFANFRATSNVSMNSGTLIGLVRYLKNPASSPFSISRGIALALSAITGMCEVASSAIR